MILAGFDIGWPVIAPRGSHVEWARSLPHAVHALGFGDLRAEGEFQHFFGGSDTAESRKISWTKVRDALAASGADVAEWDRELAELDDPTQLFVGPTTFGVIARKQ